MSRIDFSHYNFDFYLKISTIFIVNFPGYLSRNSGVHSSRNCDWLHQKLYLKIFFSKIDLEFLTCSLLYWLSIVAMSIPIVEILRWQFQFSTFLSPTFDFLSWNIDVLITTVNINRLNVVFLHHWVGWRKWFSATNQVAYWLGKVS